MALKALLVGINYTTKSFLRLNGCVNDVYLAKDYLLEKNNVKPENIKVMVDDCNYNDTNNHQSLWPTKKNLLESLTSFLKSSQAGNVLLFHYSGHGTQVTDNDGSTHEALVPLDARDCGNKFENVILESELEKIILEHTPTKVTLYVILDCCYYVGGDIEKVTRVLLPHRASGSQSRVAIPRGLCKNPQLFGTSANVTEASRTMVAMMKDANEKRKEINIISFTAGSKLEPVADATFNYKGFGAFSYFLYNTVQLNKPLQNIKIIDTVRDSIKRANFTQNPQLVVCSRIEQNKWSFLSNTEGDANTTVVMLRDLVAISGSSDIMNLNNKEIEELHILDAAATLEVKRQVSWYSKERGIHVPFVAQDIARVIASVSGRSVLKITQNQGIEESISFAAASVAIRETIIRVFQQLLLDPVNGKRANVKQPDLFNLMDNVVNMSVDKITREYLSEDKIKKEFVERATANSLAVALPSISTILSQPIDLSMQLSELCSQITPKSAGHLPATNKLIARCIDLAKQIVSAIIACDLYRLDNNKKLPSLHDMANEISHKVEFKFNDSFISQIAASFVPQVEVEKAALSIVKEIAKDRVFILDQDLEDRVSEITTRFGNFISLVSPVGPTLLSSLSSHNNPFTFVESFLGSMCKVAVDDVLTGLTTQANWGTSKFFPSSKIPVLFKVAAKSVAEVSAYSTLNYLKTCNNIALSSGTLAGIVNAVAKNAVMKVFELFNQIIDRSGASGVQLDGIGKEKNGYLNVFYSLAHIAVHASTTGIKLSLQYDSPRAMDYATKQAISNHVCISATRFFSILPILGAAIPLVRSTLGNNQFPVNNELLSFGTEILATSVASLIQRGAIYPQMAEDIVRDAIPALSSASFTSTNSITETVVVSIQRACEQRNLKSATYDLKSIRRDVSKIAKYFESFHPMPLFATTFTTAPNFDVRSVLEGLSSFVVQQVSSFVPEGYQKAGESKAVPPFILNIGKTSGIVAAYSLICLLRNRGVLTPSFSKYNELLECLKRLSVTVARKGVFAYALRLQSTSATTSNLASVTVLEKLSEFIVTEVAKEVELLTGSVATTSFEAADAVADQSYHFGALLPILASVTPDLIHGMVEAISNFSSLNQGLAYSAHINVQVVALATIDIICENYYLLKSKSGAQITNENILEIMNLAIQNSRESQTTVEQAIRKAFQMEGLKGEISDLSIRSVIIRATRILDATETTRSFVEDLELEMVEPIVTMIIQQRSVGMFVPFVYKMLAKLAGTISGKSAVSMSRNLLQNRTITPDIATLFIINSMQNATNMILNMQTSSKGPRDGCSFEQMVLETSQSSVERALDQYLGANKGAIDVTREIRSVYGVADISRKLGALGATDINRAISSTRINETEVGSSFRSVGASPMAARLVRELCLLMINSNPSLRSDDPKFKNIINEVNGNITTEFNNSNFITQLGASRKPLDIIEQMVTAQLNQAFTRNGVEVPNNMSNQVKTVLGEFCDLSPLPTPVAATRGGIYDTMSPLVSSLATGVVTELSQSMTYSSTDRTRRISPFVLMLARSIAELSANAALEAIFKLNANVNYVLTNSILSTVARRSAQKVIELTSTVATGTSAASAPRWGSLLISVLPFIVDIVMQAVSNLTGMSTGQLSRDSQVTVMEAVKSASRCVNPLLLGVTDQMFGVVQTSSQSLTETNELTSIGSDAAASIAFILATQEADGRFAEKFASDAATTFQRNTNKFVNEEWSQQRLEEEVSKAVFQTVSSSDNMRKRNETELRAVVGTTMPQFIPLLPPSIPVCGTQRSKDELLAKVDQQVISTLSAYKGPEFTRTIARGAAQVAAGATVDTVGCMQRKTGASSDQLLNAALEVGVKTANVVLNSYSNKSRATSDSVVLSDIMNTCRPIIQEGVVMASGQSNVRDIDIQSITSTQLANNTRFFGSLLPVLSTVGPSVVNTISTILSGRSSDTYYKAYEAAALTTASCMIESTGTQEINNSMIETAVRGCVDRLNSITTASGRSGNDLSLENVMRTIEQVLQSSNYRSLQTIPKLEIEGRLRTIGDCFSIPSWGKMNTSWGKLGSTTMPGGIAPTKPSMLPHTEYPDQVVKMATQVLQIYNGSPFYHEELSKSAVQKAIDAVLTYPRLSNFPDTFVCELAKMAGCIAAKEMQRQNPDSNKAVTLGLAVVAQLLTPNELPRAVCIGGQAR